MSMSAHGEHISVAAKDVPICQQFPQKHLPCLLGDGEEVEYSPGQVIVNFGQPATHAYVVLRGRGVGASDLAFQLGVIIRGPQGVGGGRPLRAGTGRSAICRGPGGYDADADSRSITSELFERVRCHPETALDLLVQLASMVRTRKRRESGLRIKSRLGLL
jgi:hypothetical protein